MSRYTAMYRYAVTGDHSRLVYSRHCTEAAARRAARSLARKWGASHPGSEPRIVEICRPADLADPAHILGGKVAS